MIMVEAEHHVHELQRIHLFCEVATFSEQNNLYMKKRISWLRLLCVVAAIAIISFFSPAEKQPCLAYISGKLARILVLTLDVPDPQTYRILPLRFAQG